MKRYKSKVIAVLFDGTAEAASTISALLNGAETSIGDNGELTLPQGHQVLPNHAVVWNEATRIVTVLTADMFASLYCADTDKWESQEDLVENQEFHSAVRAAKAGRLIRRKPWPDGMFVVAQVPSTVPTEIIPKMSSLPADAKAVFITRGRPIHYSDQYIVVFANNEIMGWVPAHADFMQEDWQILPVSDFTLPAAPVSETAGTAVPDKDDRKRTTGPV